MGLIIFTVIFGAIILVCIIRFILWILQAQKKRREAMAQIAHKLDLNYLEEYSDYKDTEYNSFKLFNEGHSRKAYNVIGGKKENCAVDIFDYVYVTGAGKNRQTHYYSVCILIIPQRFKSLYIRRENFFDKIAGVIGFDDIDFESKEFSSKYYVKSDDKKFAYDIIHPQMMEFLLRTPQVPFIEINSRHLAFYVGGKIKPETYIGLYDFASKFYGKTPGYVLDEYKS